MSHLKPLLALVPVHFAAMAIPGPNVLVVTQASASTSRRAGLYTAVGVAAGAAALATLAVIGLGLVLSRFADAYVAVKLGGGAYLLYRGWRTWREADKPISSDKDMTTTSGWRAALTGLGTNLANPKAIVFFASFLVIALPPGIPVWVRIAAVAMVALDALVWHSVLALAFSTGPVQGLFTRARRWISRIVGAVMAGFGADLVLSAR